MRIVIAADHNGVALKTSIVESLIGLGHEVEDLGSHEGDGEVDYPPLCAELCRQIVAGTAERGIVLGGSGLGETVACNKIRGIRAGLCHDAWSAGISRGHNDANVLVLAAKVLDAQGAATVVETWLATAFKGGVHQRRLDQIADLECAADAAPAAAAATVTGS
ncbi:MAG TPA: RpiB/LacA/LacB family sugar-phosphate isomerase [Actinospica sp.]|jgi:ribose 5-phosphate isomerase B|nr:RpiB/LacA/LacB family sugar-phosphate isomerase [Actinospica sp.]